MPLTVSVVVATYQGERYLGEQLASIAAQTAPPHEVVVTDDGSTDGTLAVVEAFAAGAPFPVTVLRQHRLGLGANFLAGAAAATGSHLAWCDQDDVWAPTKLAACAEAIQSTGAVLVCHDSAPVDAELRPLPDAGMRRITRRRVVPALRGDTWFVDPGHATVLQRRLLELVDPAARPASHIHPGPWHHDELTHYLALVAGARAYLPQTLVQYRQHGANSAGAPPAMGAGQRLSLGSGGMRRRAELLGAWSPYLAPAAADGGPDPLARLRRVYGDRADRYETPHRGRRAAALAGAVLRGDYRPRSRGLLGWRSLALDAVNVPRRLAT